MEKKFKEFFATSWAIDNKISVYVLVFIISVFGIINYYTIPKEQIPEIVIPMINVNTMYPGTARREPLRAAPPRGVIPFSWETRARMDSFA